MRVSIGYPDRRSEFEILDDTSVREVRLEPVIDAEQVVMMIEATEQVRMVDSLREYIVDLSHAESSTSRTRVGIVAEGLGSIGPRREGLGQRRDGGGSS